MNNGRTQREGRHAECKCRDYPLLGNGRHSIWAVMASTVLGSIVWLDPAPQFEVHLTMTRHRLIPYQNAEQNPKEMVMLRFLCYHADTLSESLASKDATQLVPQFATDDYLVNLLAASPLRKDT
ncbi:unnamed protein product [Cylicocyclus nassatus]|uniref:Uncharacterized protein n=1 Tax=Cylicocyclus nassatus TaxID=53992 RepID=A0AA36HBB8_CYLNA|nr:unnamed protein product [Cylicocyclus nassatus]